MFRRICRWAYTRTVKHVSQSGVKHGGIYTDGLICVGYMYTWVIRACGLYVIRIRGLCVWLSQMRS